MSSVQQLFSHQLDPEELAKIMDDYHNVASEKIRGKGGYVAQFQGDGVMAYFGWPTVHEDDASRAVAAGLELAEALPRLSTPGGLPIEVRVGVATGLVVVGGESAAEGRPVGEMPNISVVTSEAVRRRSNDGYHTDRTTRSWFVLVRIDDLARPVHHSEWTRERGQETFRLHLL